MYVTSVVNGMPVQSFLPDAVLPILDAQRVARFAAMDLAIGGTRDAASYQDACATAVLRDGRRPVDAERRMRVASACRSTVGRLRVNQARLQDINSKLTGEPGGYRRTHTWMGGPHPSHAWHVGSPPERIAPAVARVLQIRDAERPACLVALVSMLRLLQIHPFPDGNGRTARLYACWLVENRLGPCIAFPQLVHRLWDLSRFDIHAASNELRDTNSVAMLTDFASNALSPDMRATRIPSEERIPR